MTTALYRETSDALFEVGTGNGRHGQNEGEAKKRERLTLLRQRRAIYVRRGQRALLNTLLRQQTATADHVRQAVELPPSIDPTLFGSVPGPLARGGIIEAVGFAKTNRPTAHARPITVWRMNDRDAAIDWLLANPDLPDFSPSDDLPLFAANEKRPTVAAAGQDSTAAHKNQR